MALNIAIYICHLRAFAGSCTNQGQLSSMALLGTRGSTRRSAKGRLLPARREHARNPRSLFTAGLRSPSELEPVGRAAGSMVLRRDRH